MKHTITFLVALLISISSYAQQGINYKAILKDTNGNVLASTFMNVQFTIHQSTATGTIVYQEGHNYTTDANGMLILNIGTDPSPNVGTFASIDWSAGKHFLQVTITYSGGTINFDATEFMAVPYALNSLTSSDNYWSKNGNNIYTLNENVGIGTNNPATRLNISDANNASILLQTPSTSDVSSIRLENGNVAGQHNFFKIENRSDLLRIVVDSDIDKGTGYTDVVTVSVNGDISTEGSLSLAVGNTINEFSSDGTLTGNSNNAVPTERAVKTYVDGKSSMFSESIVSLIFGGSQTLANTSFAQVQATSPSSLTITNNTNFITVHVNVDGTITKFYMTSSTSPVVVAYPGGEGTSLQIKIFAFDLSALFFDGLKLTGNQIIGLLKVKE